MSCEGANAGHMQTATQLWATSAGMSQAATWSQSHSEAQPPSGTGTVKQRHSHQQAGRNPRAQAGGSIRMRRIRATLAGLSQAATLPQETHIFRHQQLGHSQPEAQSARRHPVQWGTFIRANSTWMSSVATSSQRWLRCRHRQERHSHTARAQAEITAVYTVQLFSDCR